MVSIIFYFHPYLGKISNLTNIFQLGWNHQPVYVFLCKHPLHVCIFIHLATRNADVCFWGVLFFVCMFLPSPFFSTASYKPLNLNCCQVGSSKNSTEQLSFWERCCTHRQYQGVDMGEGCVFFRVFPRFIYIKNEGLGGDMLNTIGSTGVT